MKVLELFCGTKSFTKVAESGGHECRTLDNDPRFNPTYCMDIMVFEPIVLGGWRPDIIWASPPCNCFTQAAISHNWSKHAEGVYTAKRIEAIQSQAIFEYTNELMGVLGPKAYFIENPCSSLRKRDFMRGHPYRRTVTYCQYAEDGLTREEKRQKRTDIWTNFDGWTPRPQCKNKALCHARAERGSKTGTQGIKGSIARAVVPARLCEEILIACEKGA